MMLKVIDVLVRLCPPAEPALDLPGWMRCLHSKMVAPDSRHNVRLFIARLVVNRSKDFQPYAREWIRSETCCVLARQCLHLPS